MKINRLFAIAALAALAGGCGHPHNTDKTADTLSSLTFNIEEFKPAAATKVSWNGTYSAWTEGDIIGVFPDKGGDQVSFTVSGDTGTSTCTFDGHGWGLSTSARYSAYYPFSAVNYGDAGAYKNVAVSYIGQSQSEKNAFGVGNYDFLACTNAIPSFTDASDGGSCTFNFNHLGALIILDIILPTSTSLSKIELICNSDLFTQSGTVDLSQGTASITPTVKSNSLCLNLDGMAVSANETVRFYLMSAPANLTAELPTIRATTTSGTAFSKRMNVSYNMVAGRAYIFDPVTLEASDYLTVAQNNFNLKYPFSSVTLDVITNNNYTINITSGSDWVSLSDNSSLHPSFDVKINGTASTRTATILLKSTSSNLSQTVTITQGCPPSDVPIPVSHIMPCCRWNNYGTTFLVNNVWNSYHDYNDISQCRSILKTIAEAGIRVVSIDFTNQAQWDSQWESDNFKGRLNNIAQVCGEIGMEWFLFIGNLGPAPGISYWNGIAERIWNSYAQLDHYHYKDGKPMLLIFMPGTSYNSAINSASAANKTYLKNGDKFTIGTCQVNEPITPTKTDGWGYRNYSQSSDGAVRFVCPNSGVPPQDWARINATDWSSRMDWGLQASRYIVIGSYDDTCDAIFWGIANVSASTTECHKNAETVNDPYIYYNIVKEKLLGE